MALFSFTDIRFKTAAKRVGLNGKLVEQNALMQSRLSSLESIGELEEEEEVEQSPLNAMLSNPQLQETIVAGIMGLVGNMFSKTTQSQ